LRRQSGLSCWPSHWEGGLYVPPTDQAPPNPFLAHIPDRDVETTKGKKLTLINPAYMTRQVHELGREKYGLRGHITSLKPLRPENAADPWETEALHAFAAGSLKETTRQDTDGQPFFRLMRPLFAEAPCLKCHSAQGYALGDIIGGISVSVPMRTNLGLAAQQRLRLVIAHLVIGVLGLAGLGAGHVHFRNFRRSLQESEDRFEQLAEHSCSVTWEVDAAGLFTFVGKTSASVLGYQPGTLVGNMHFFDLHPEEGREAFKSAAFEVFARKGPFMTDGYSGYQALGESDGVVHVGCMAHIRRKFVDVQKATSKKIMHGTAKEILDLIGLLYKVEHNIKELEPEKKVANRREQAVPILDAIRTILDERIDHVPPKSLLGQAMTYARNQWSRAVRYVDCELLTPDNNAAENAIRPVALGRKNWLFAGVPKGADASAMLFSLVETAKANEIEPQAYLKFLFEHFPAAQSTEDMKALMPQHVDRSLLPSLPKPKPRKK
jgi:PAS domain-containing protein